MSFPLAQLRDIHAAPLPSDGLSGWQLGLLGLAALSLLAAALLAWQRWQRQAPWRQAKATLAKLSAQPQLAPHHLNQWLKGLILLYLPREQVAALSDQPWLAQLDQLGNTDFSRFWPAWQGWLYGGAPLSAEQRAALLAECHRLLATLGKRRPSC